VASRQSLSQEGAPSDRAPKQCVSFVALPPSTPVTTDTSLFLRTIRTIETMAYGPLSRT
jgi:hypothetical protein